MTYEQEQAIMFDPQIQDMRSRFEAHGLDFNTIIKKQLDKISGGIKNQNTKAIVEQLVGILQKELETCIAKNAGKWFQKLGNLIKSLFTKKK